MRFIQLTCLSLLLAACASQKAAVPQSHRASLPASFARPPTPAESQLATALAARSHRAHSAHGQGEQCRKQDPSPHKFDFRGADANGDGKVSKGEFNCKALSWFGHADPDRNHRLELKHAHKSHVAELSRFADARSQNLNVMQFLAAMDRRFARADRDRNGFLNEKEFAAASLASLPKGAR